MSTKVVINGRYPKSVTVEGGDLTIGGRELRTLRHRDPLELPWTKVIDGDLIKVMSGYDNEWGYANQMLREALALTGARRS